MMARRPFGRGVLALVAGAGAAALGGCGMFGGNEQRFKITIIVDTPAGQKMGSAVWKATQITTRNPIAGPKVRVQFQGEAVAVDIAAGKTLFALLTSADGDVDYAKRLPDRALGSRLLSDKEDLDTWRNSAELYPTAPKTIGLARTNPLPMLVTFADLSDARSVERVDPGDLAAIFGDGVMLKRITIEKTRDDVTVGIGKRLGWLNDREILENTGWSSLPYESRVAINGLVAGKIERAK
jgi:hypothetical protein